MYTVFTNMNIPPGVSYDGTVIDGIKILVLVQVCKRETPMCKISLKGKATCRLHKMAPKNHLR
jgi:hypothetical protein